MSDCIFCKIARGEAPATIVYEDEETVVFENIEPKTPIHLLAIPKKHIESVDTIEDDEIELIGKLIVAARKGAHEKGLEQGYKLAVNVGKGGGQEVFHIHIHILGFKE